MRKPVVILDLSDLVSVANQIRSEANPEDRFSRVVAHLIVLLYHPGVYPIQTDLNKQFDLSLLCTFFFTEMKCLLES